MLNPLIQSLPLKNGKYSKKVEKKAVAHQDAATFEKQTRQPSLVLWVGNLLIRMGKRLTEPNMEMKRSREHA